LPDSPSFAWACTELERLLPLSEIESRGTIRLVLRQYGLEVGSVRPNEMQVLFRKALPDALRIRGVDESQDLCEEIALRLPSEVDDVEGMSAVDSPEAVFQRLGGGENF